MTYTIYGKGLIMLDANGTMNYFSYENNKELYEMLSRFYEKQGIKDITVIDCDSKEVYFVDEYSYDIIMNKIKESE